MVPIEIDKVVKLDLGYKPDASVSGPVLIQTQYSTCLTFNAKFSKRGKDGRYPAAGIAFIEFPHCNITKFGLPNDEAWSGHPLSSKIDEIDGWCEIIEVHNSSWKAELERQNQVAFPNCKWASRHFIISFHDSTFECLADDIQLIILEETETYELLFQRLAKRIIKDVRNS